MNRGKLFTLMIVLLGWTLLASSPSAASQSCPHRRLDEMEGNPLNPATGRPKFMPHLEQSGDNYCWAAVTAQLVDYYRFTNGDTNYTRTSPLPTYFRKCDSCYSNPGTTTPYTVGQFNCDGGASNELGRPEEAFRDMMAAGACDHGALLNPRPSATSLRGQGEVSYQDFRPLEEQLRDMWGRMRIGSLSDENARKEICEFQRDTMGATGAVANASRDAILAAFRTVDRGSRYGPDIKCKFLNTFVSEICKTPGASRSPITTPPLPAPELAEYEADQSEFKSTLDRALDAPRTQPAIIRLNCANFLNNPTGACTGGHFVMVVGRSERAVMRNGRQEFRCGYYIRNSWGSMCDSFGTRSLDCDSKGNVWIDETELFGAVSDIVTLK